MVLLNKKLFLDVIAGTRIYDEDVSKFLILVNKHYTQQKSNIFDIFYSSLNFTEFNYFFYFMNLNNSFDQLKLIFGAAEGGQKSFQISATPIMYGIVSLHHFIVIFLFFIIGLVGFLLGWLLITHHIKDLPYSKNSFLFFLIQKGDYRGYLSFLLTRPDNIINNFFFVDLATNLNLIKFHVFVKKFTHWTNLEVIWTLIPSLILVIIAFPSFLVLYSLDETVYEPMITIKTIGHQWFWDYEFSSLALNNTDYKSILKIESYMIPENELKKGDLRLLETDNSLFLPTKVNIRVLVTSVDVLHSWAVPALGAKIDACPGRLNQIFLYILNRGVYYGQCSEICGVNHAFMPIKIIALSFKDWFQWYINKF